MPIFGGIEAGGSKFVCGVGTGPEDLRVVEIPTTQPRETISRAVEFFRGHANLAAVGIASFGPIDVNPESPTFGYITSTPKRDWQNFDFVGAIKNALALPVAFDTDVNGAALAEHQWGAARGLHDFLYVTVGTGIGGGAIVNGQLLHGRGHPEMGHVRIPQDCARDPFPGICPYHGNCLEGLASGPAIESRWGQAASRLPDGHPAWDLEAEYLALGILNWASTLAPQCIVLGGGVAKRAELWPRVRESLARQLNGYMDPPELVPPFLGPRAGVLGAIALANGLAREPRISRHN